MMRVDRCFAGRAGSDSGFSLIELTVSLMLTLVITGAAVSIVTPGTTSGRVEPEVVDVQQRARVALDAIARDLQAAGAGVYLGPAVGPLRRFFAPVLPRRAGLQNADAFFVARADAITIVHVPGTVVQTALRDPLPSAGADLYLESPPHCVPFGVLCGLAPGASLLVFDTEGHFDLFTLTQINVMSGRLRPWQASHPTHNYPAGAVVAEAAWHTYYLDLPNRQLRHSDGYLTDIPVVDNVVGLAFEYFGDSLPPVAPRPPLGTPNCLYDATGSPQPGMTALAAQGGSLAALPLSMFGDGPWCGSGENRFDADLLRVRMVRVALRVQAGNVLFRAGRVPDYTVRVDVSPRNLGGQQ